jgi:hypothetical protein
MRIAFVLKKNISKIQAELNTFNASTPEHS